jgi:hypothetical protein
VRELAGDTVSDGDQVAGGAIAAGLGLGGLPTGNVTEPETFLSFRRHRSASLPGDNPLLD